jgi:molecular chaperone GrpE (heat shock protein)
MSHKRLIWEEVSQLATLIASHGSLSAAEVGELVEHMGRLARVQFKANTLQEATLEQQRATLATLQATSARQEGMIAALHQNHRKDIELARHDLLLAMLPVVDGLEAAVASGRRQVARMASGGDAHIALSAWVEGLRLVHQRMLDVLAQADVEPILAVGQPFDPRVHIATGVDTSGRASVGVVVEEERRGYRTRDGVLRYAEVVVARPAAPPPAPAPPQRPEPVRRVPDPFIHVNAE